MPVSKAKINGPVELFLSQRAASRDLQFRAKVDVFMNPSFTFCTNT